MKKILWITNRDVTSEPIVSSLDYCADDFNLEIHKKYYTNSSKQFDASGFDVVVYMGGAEMVTSPPVKTFQNMRQQAKVAMICCDASCKGWTPYLEIYHKEQCFDLIVNIDGSENWNKVGLDYTALTPIDPRFYNILQPWESRQVLFGFSGGINAERADIIRRIGLIITINTRSEAVGSYPGFANFLQRCKFVLNMNERNTVKGRALETAHAGACFVEQKAAEDERNTMLKWFDKSLFLFYNNPEDIGDLIFDNIDKGKEIARAFSAEVMEKHNTKKFWKKLLDTVA